MGWLTDPGYWPGRLIFQRGLAAIYLLAFLCAVDQFRALAGERGLTPVPAYLRRVSFQRAPSLFHLHYSDRFLAAVSWAGVVLSAAALGGLADVVPLGAATALWAVLWALYLSIVNVGQVWYGFGWESLLCEAGFLAVFLGNARTAPPVLILWLLRWLLFRLEFGAGLIKLRGDRCWRDLTCLYYHHETQPMPNPLSWYFHHLPKPLHRVEVAANHVTQLIVPFGLFAPQPYATVAAAIVIVTQFWLILSGNFAWLNWITAILATSVVDWRAFGLAGAPRPAAEPLWHQALVIAVTVLVVVLSYWPARNLISRRQRMNASFNPLHLVNSYGAFGSITKVRYEVVIEGTEDPDPGPGSAWREYEFKGKPGDPRRRPPQYAPYHLRLDWLMWFAGLSSLYAEPWIVPLAERLLENDRAILRLLRHNPFPGAPPAVVRARLYRYRFTTWHERRETGRWWDRTLVREYLPPIGLRPTAGATSESGGMTP
ncbi:lipase maturation factor family protein [Actinoallomurus rhizosphaericola]|uniref:lipase maturation factor family protein n=1 Tax=Actinoallomurus rhizosphaericola TaxID=2952536 RepID=UPI002091E67D|nr:lipase maturation factor family protein [Actinoallomurus rhizosphaericola]MCO5999746.1 lipase maturation factor family protein [Actinoallomurus rhizosphaericola]